MTPSAPRGFRRAIPSHGSKSDTDRNPANIRVFCRIGNIDALFALNISVFCVIAR